MQFLMLVCNDTVPVDAPEKLFDVEEWVETNDARGTRIMGNPIHPEHEARTVRVRKDKLLVTDGPFVETKEILAGFDILECADMDEAIAIASTHPMSQTGVIELRQIMTDL
jgi:hypothetical protein